MHSGQCVYAIYLVFLSSVMRWQHLPMHKHVPYVHVNVLYKCNITQKINAYGIVFLKVIESYMNMDKYDQAHIEQTTTCGNGRPVVYEQNLMGFVRV